MSSNDIAIKVESLSKCYQIYAQPQDRLKQSIYPRLQRLAGKQPKQYCREFWALKDISFEIKKGETVGVIGRNGSGKSTLLQTICGTLNPTSGSIQTNGRIAALLELGSGFNPEFTGRENVYMNAAILGLTQAEIDYRFEDILSFADIGEFIEQPVKTYSSGMFVRLAFAVNIMSKPEIMIVDEALAVGDMRFQAKCITALKRVQEDGATVLFVSHDVGTVKSLCTRGIYLEHGNLKSIGTAPQIAEEYIRTMRVEMNSDHNQFASFSTVDVPTKNKDSLKQKSNSVAIFKESKEFDARVDSTRYGTGEARISYVELLDENGESLVEVDFDQEVSIKIYFISNTNKIIAPAYYIQDDKKILILGAGPLQLGASFIEAMDKQRFVVTYKTRLPLQDGIYSMQFQLNEPVTLDGTANFLDVIDDAIVFRMNRRSSGRIWTKVYIANTLGIETL
ncbi:MAG: ABC transporter ATP-binding protein [Halieaceae bacterium]|nr:ABC transporter ATP-binding protein [Halieaceae bacterium]